MRTGTLEPGDWVIFRKTKHSEHPGPRASNVAPAPFGEGYSYTIDKYWVVQEVLADGALRLRTRRGKEHIVAPNDPRLRRANLFQRLFYRSRFVSVLEQPLAPPSSPGPRQHVPAA
jgi:hypothetical protein